MLGDLASRIKNTSDEGEKMRLATLAVGDQLAGPFLSAINQSKTGLADLASASRDAGSSFTNDLAKGAQSAMAALSNLGERADTIYAQIKRAIGLANDADKVKAAQADLRQAQGHLRTVEVGAGGFFQTKTQDDVAVAALEVERKRFALQDIDGTKDKAAALQKALAKNYGPQLPPGGMPAADDDDGDAKGGRGRGSSSAASKQEDDRAERVLQRLRERLAATQAISDETGTLGEKQRIVNELVNAGVSAESEMGQQITSLVRQIDEQTEAQRRHNQVLQEMRTVAGDVASALDGWIVQGRKFDDVLSSLVKQMESQALRSLLMGSGSGKDGGLFGGATSLLSSMFGGSSSSAGVGSIGSFLSSPGVFQFANGGVMTTRGPLALRRYAGGGIADSPQLALYGEAGAEAYVPLPDGRSIPVNMRVPVPSITVSGSSRSGGGDYRPTINPVFNVTGVTSREEVTGWIQNGMAQAHAAALRDMPGALQGQRDRSF